MVREFHFHAGRQTAPLLLQGGRKKQTKKQKVAAVCTVTLRFSYLRLFWLQTMNIIAVYRNPNLESVDLTVPWCKQRVESCSVYYEHL